MTSTPKSSPSPPTPTVPIDQCALPHCLFPTPLPLNVSALGTSSEWNPAVFDLLCLAYLTQRHVFKGHPCCTVYLKPTPCYSLLPLCCMNTHISLIHSPVDGHLGHFHLLPVVTNAVLSHLRNCQTAVYHLPHFCDTIHVPVGRAAFAHGGSEVRLQRPSRQDLRHVLSSPPRESCQPQSKVTSRCCLCRLESQCHSLC